MFVYTIKNMSKEFFEELEKFLPVYVRPLPSYLHASLVFSIVVLIGVINANRTKVIFDINGDSKESTQEKKMKKFILIGTSVVIAIFLADVTFNISWKLRNKVNRKHLVYSRWFPGIFQNAI